MEISWKYALGNGVDLCVKEDQKLYQVSLAEGSKKKKRKVKSQFLTVSGSVATRLFLKVCLCSGTISHIDNDGVA